MITSFFIQSPCLHEDGWQYKEMAGTRQADARVVYVGTMGGYLLVFDLDKLQTACASKWLSNRPESPPVTPLPIISPSAPPFAIPSTSPSVSLLAPSIGLAAPSGTGERRSWDPLKGKPPPQVRRCSQSSRAPRDARLPCVLVRRFTRAIRVIQHLAKADDGSCLLLACVLSAVFEPLPCNPSITTSFELKMILVGQFFYSCPCIYYIILLYYFYICMFIFILFLPL